MFDTKTSIFQELARPVIKLIIGITSLLVIGVIISVLPMLNALDFSNDANLLIAGVINTVIIVFILRFARDVKRIFKENLSMFPESGDIAKWLIIFVGIVVGYKAYYQMARAFLGRGGIGIYHWIFLLLAAIPLFKLIMLLYRNIDKITTLTIRKARFIGKKTSDTKVELKQIKCSECGFLMPEESKFCGKCGVQIQKGESEIEKEIQRCPKCNSEVPDTAKFCRHCGTKLA